jgi:hypothetical protein
MDTMQGSGLLGPRATPEQVAIVNDLLRQVREHWRLACAWEHVDPTMAGALHPSPDNPYMDGYLLAVHRFERYAAAHREAN